MDVLSTCPLRVASLIWQPRPGAWVLTVVCKATVFLRPGECALAPAQISPADEDQHPGDDPARSVRIPRDLVPVKPSVDVLLIGSAFAPDKRPVRSLVARLSVGELDKSVEVVADRAVRADGAVREGQPFVQMPLAYERAAGGPGTSNPVGVRPDARDAEGFVRAPNLRRPGTPPEGPFDPLGFGPIAPAWPERRERLSGAAAAWSFKDLGQRPLPEGMDLGFFNAAPRDQQLRALDERARITLENLHPEHATLVTTLPLLAPRAVLEGRRTGPLPIALRADTLLFDTDRGLCAVTYRGMVPLESATEAGRVVVSMDGYAAEPSGLFKAPLGGMTADLPLEVRRAALPFAQAPQAPPAPPPLSAPAPLPVASPWAAGSPLSAATPPTVPLPVVPLAPAPVALPIPDPAVAVARAVRIEPAPTPAPRVDAGGAVEIIWFDPEHVPRVRRKAAWRPLLDALEQAPLDPELDDPAFAKDPMAIEDRREIFHVLTNAEPTGAQGLEETLARCRREDGRFVPALAVFAGELELPFDELAALRATLTTVAPLVGQDEALKSAVQAAKDFLATPGLMSAPAVAEALTKRMEDAFAQGKRVVPPGYLEAQRERALLEQRQYQRRTVFGNKHLRGLLKLGGPDAAPAEKSKPAPPGASSIVPAYLPESLAGELPMFPRFRVRLLAEVRLPADRYETHAAALRVLGLARVATATG